MFRQDNSSLVEFCEDGKRIMMTIYRPIRFNDEKVDRPQHFNIVEDKKEKNVA